MDSSKGEGLYLFKVWGPIWAVMILSASNLANSQYGPTFSVSYRGVTWAAVTNRCEQFGKRLCLRKDICHYINKQWKPRRSINVPTRSTWIPIADQHNEWMLLGLKIPNQCAKLTKMEGPPFWHPRGCQRNFMTDKSTSSTQKEPVKKGIFCNTRKGYFCCNKTVDIPTTDPRPQPVYIFSRKEKSRAHYLFTLDRYLRERRWENDQAAWRKSGVLDGDVSKVTLMSGYVKNRFENPVYFCYRDFRNSANLVTTLHKVSKTWCDGMWRFNFHAYGNYSSANDSNFQRLIVGNSVSKFTHSRISLQESPKFRTTFSIYGPSDSSNHTSFIHRSYIAKVGACDGNAEILTTKTGFISSPNYPRKYNSKAAGNVNCTWKIIAPFGSIVKISFKSMKLSPKMKRATPLVFRKFQGRKVARYHFYSACPIDRVNIKGYGRFCGNALPPNFFTIGNKLNINLFGKRGSRGTNFALYYEMIAPRHHREEITVSRNDSFSWISANKTCAQKGKSLCKARDICISDSRPFYGVKEGDQWAPIKDEYNDWIQIGRGNVDTCLRHNAVLGPPRWGVDNAICVVSNISQPCPVRKHAYCCEYASSPSALPVAKAKAITVDVYSTIQNGILLYKYVRKGIDNARSFDSAGIWRMLRRRSGGITSFTLQREWSQTFNKVVFFCSLTVIPSIGRIRKAFAMSLTPCEESGWKYLYHLHCIGKPTASSVKLFVGVYSSRPFHTHVNGIRFTPQFRSADGFIIYAATAKMTAEPIKDSGYVGRGDQCDNFTMIIEAPTILQSPGYPKSYATNAYCTWHVELPEESRQRGDRLKLTIEELNLEDPVDILNVQEISWTNETTDRAPRNQSSLSKRGQDFTGIVTQSSMTTDQSFYLTFKTDSSISRKGFRVRFDILPDDCGGVIKANSKILTHNDKFDSDGGYSCFWSISAPQNQTIVLKFVTFDLTPGGNCSEKIYVTFYAQQRIFCGNNVPPRLVTTDSNTANVTFFSLKSKRSKIEKKFYIEVVFVDKEVEKRPPNIQCGVQSVPFASDDPVSERIVNGKVAANGNFPWLVMIGRPGVTCGGTLINNRLVLTATHCFILQYLAGFGAISLHAPLSKYVIIAGRYRRDIPSPGEQIFNITSLFVHGGYQRFAAQWTNRHGLQYLGVFPYNDLALAKLDREAKFTFSVSPACLPTQDAHAGDFCYVAGWGSISPTKVQVRAEMNYARVPILDSSICDGWEEMKGTVMENSLCAGFVRGGGDHCWGDSGGSLVCRGKYGNFYVNGIVSWSRECAGTRTPGVYTRVWKFVDWILGVIENSA